MLMDEKSVHEMLRQMEGWLDKQSPRPVSVLAFQAFLRIKKVFRD